MPTHGSSFLGVVLSFTENILEDDANTMVGLAEDCWKKRGEEAMGCSSFFQEKCE
jgi:hypothetical protein